MLLNLVNSSGEYLLGRYAVTKANDTDGAGPESKTTRENFIGQTYSRFFSTVNLSGFVLQLFVVSRVFKFLGVRKALFIHPVAVFLGYLTMAGSPSIGKIYWLKVVDNSIDYSLGRQPNRPSGCQPAGRPSTRLSRRWIPSLCGLET